MRKTLIFLPLLLASSPTLAEPAPQLLPQLADPATAQKLTEAMQSMSTAPLNIRIGTARAELEGRPPAPGEQDLNHGDLARSDDPNFDPNLSGHIATRRPTVH